MDNTNVMLTVLLVVSLFIVGSFLYVTSGITGLATASVDSGYDYWPLIAGMTGVLGIGGIVAAAHMKQ